VLQIAVPKNLQFIISLTNLSLGILSANIIHFFHSSILSTHKYLTIMVDPLTIATGVATIAACVFALITAIKDGHSLLPRMLDKLKRLFGRTRTIMRKFYNSIPNQKGNLFTPM
jgi:hypothetical protein